MFNSYRWYFTDKQKKEAGNKEVYYIKIREGGHGVRHPELSKQMVLFFRKYLYNEKSIRIDETELINVPR